MEGAPLAQIGQGLGGQLVDAASVWRREAPPGPLNDRHPGLHTVRHPHPPHHLTLLAAQLGQGAVLQTGSFGVGGVQQNLGLAALGAGLIRDGLGTYTYAWWGGAALCVIAAVLSIAVRRRVAPDARSTAAARLASEAEPAPPGM